MTSSGHSIPRYEGSWYSVMTDQTASCLMFACLTARVLPERWAIITGGVVGYIFFGCPVYFFVMLVRSHTMEEHVMPVTHAMMVFAGIFALWFLMWDPQKIYDASWSLIGGMITGSCVLSLATWNIKNKIQWLRSKIKSNG